MNKVSHILVNTVEHTIHHFYSVEEVKAFIANTPEVLEDEANTFYKVDIIRPKRTVTIDVSI